MKLVYLSHPVRGLTRKETSGNLRRAKRWLRWYILTHPSCAVIAPWISACEVFDEDEPGVRERGLKSDLLVIEHCDEIALCGGEISPGMQCELDWAHKHNLTVRDFIAMGTEPPREASHGR